MNTITALSATPSDYVVLTTDCVGNIIYENGSLKEILLSEGCYQGGVYYYYLKDHFGNNRLVITIVGQLWRRVITTQVECTFTMKVQITVLLYHIVTMVRSWKL
jgi:hypothetical protein